MPRKSNFDEYGITLVEADGSTEVFKDGELVGRFYIDVATSAIEVELVGCPLSYIEYRTTDIAINRVKFINEWLRRDIMSAVHAGVTFLAFARFEEAMAARLGS